MTTHFTTDGRLSSRLCPLRHPAAGADRQAAPRRDPHAVRLADRRPDFRRPESGRRGARAEHVVKKGKTSVLDGDEAKKLLDSIDVSTLVGLRDRALIAVMTFAFARIGAVVAMRVEDYFPKGKRWWVRLHEKRGKRHEMPAHHTLEAYLDAYIEAAKIRRRQGSSVPLRRRPHRHADRNADASRQRLGHGAAPRRLGRSRTRRGGLAATLELRVPVAFDREARSTDAPDRSPSESVHSRGIARLYALAPRAISA